MVDQVDRRILSLLQENARISNAQIARELDLAPSGILERIRKLEKRGFIAGYHASLDAAKMGFHVTAFMFVRTEDRPGEMDTAKLLAKIPEVAEVHHIAGEDCYLVKVRCADNEDLGRILREEIGSIESVSSSRTSIVMETVKEGGLLPVWDSSEHEIGVGVTDG